VLGAVFCASGLALAAVPPFGPFLGRALIEDAAAEHGLAWIAPVLAVSTALIGGAVLRVVRTVFLGRGPVPPPTRSTAAGEAGEDPAERGRAPVATLISVVLVAAGLAWGLVPGLVDGAAAAAARFVDRGAYAAGVLRGVATDVAAPAGHGPTTTAWLWGAGSALLALAVAWAPTVPVGPLRALHSGRIGDYVAWLAAGTALVAGVLALAV
jgi:multicomponent Na+:H+ antiporter subunit D